MNHCGWLGIQYVNWRPKRSDGPCFSDRVLARLFFCLRTLEILCSWHPSWNLSGTALSEVGAKSGGIFRKQSIT